MMERVLPVFYGQKYSNYLIIALRYLRHAARFAFAVMLPVFYGQKYSNFLIIALHYATLRHATRLASLAASLRSPLTR
jgi:hypothetical protein